MYSTDCRSKPQPACSHDVFGAWGLCSGHCGMACGQGGNIWIWNQALTLPVKEPTSICLPVKLGWISSGSAIIWKHTNDRGRGKSQGHSGNSLCFTSFLNLTDFLKRKSIHIWAKCMRKLVAVAESFAQPHITPSIGHQSLCAWQTTSWPLVSCCLTGRILYCGLYS